MSNEQPANSHQVGGGHYRRVAGEQHWDRLVRLYGLPAARCYFIGNITAYVERYQEKNGIQDLEKARHYLDKLIEEERAYAAKKQAECAEAQPEEDTLPSNYTPLIQERGHSRGQEEQTVFKSSPSWNDIDTMPADRSGL